MAESKDKKKSNQITKSDNTTPKKSSTKKEVNKTKSSSKAATSKSREVREEKKLDNKKVELEVIEEMDTSMQDEKNSDVKDILLKIWDIVFWILFAILACVWIVDFFRVSDEKEPMFCIKNETIEYDDGTVDKCTGLGYKVYTYKRASLENGVQFGPFFMKMKEPNND